MSNRILRVVVVVVAVILPLDVVHVAADIPPSSRIPSITAIAARDDQGYLGNGTKSNSLTPVKVDFALGSPSRAHAAAPPSPSPTPATPAAPSSTLAPVGATLPVKGDAHFLESEIRMAAGSPDSLYVSIPVSGGDVLALLGEDMQPHQGWPLRLPFVGDCDLLLAAADGSVRAVCSAGPTTYGQGAPGPVRRAFAFNADGTPMHGWPVDLNDAQQSVGRMIGDDLAMIVAYDVNPSEDDTQRAHMLVVRADGAIQKGVDVAFSGASSWAIGPDGIAYGATHRYVYKSSVKTDIASFGVDGPRVGWPVTIDGNASELAFDGRGRVYTVVGSPRTRPARTLVFDQDGRRLPAGSKSLPIVSTSQWLDMGSEFPGAPTVADDGTAFILSNEPGGDTTIIGLDPDGHRLPGWPYRSGLSMQWGELSGSDSTGYYQLRSTAAVDSRDVLYLFRAASGPSTGGSLIAIGSDGRIRAGWPVHLRRAGSMFLSMAVAHQAGVWALAIEREPETRAYSATILAIADDGTVRGKVTIVDPSPQVAPAGPVTTITTIAAGGAHTCALTSAGLVKCWGNNERGQLGASGARSLAPGDVMGLAGEVTAIAAGGSHACALMSDGGVKCWGMSGWIWSGDTQVLTGSFLPVEIDELATGIQAIAAGGQDTCALLSDGAATCWGANDQAQLGHGTATSDALPVPVNILGLTSGVTALAVSGGHTCALTSGGGVKCWGINQSGQLGAGTTTLNSDVPLDVAGLARGVEAIAAGGSHTCALLGGGAVKCWGDNTHGQLGNGTTTGSNIPVDVSDLTSGVTAISAGGYHTCALTSGGGIKCWGDNEGGQLGDGTTTDSNIPVGVSGLESGATAISAGALHTCAITTVGEVKCWGRNDGGQLGNGTSTDSSFPVDVDFAGAGTPLTDALDPAVRQRPSDFPLLPLSAGLAAGILMMVRRRPGLASKSCEREP